MHPPYLDLYQRIQDFRLDQPDTPLPFSRRLARDNGWSLAYSHRVIAEYKKFVFLAVVAGHPVTPSDQVDQAWHLHLSYTRSYWQDFCPHVLQQPLHHDPTQGRASEQAKFKDWYSQTLASYQRWFEATPPPDIWPDPCDRFGRDLHFVRVNTQQHWVFTRLPKLPMSTPALPQRTGLGLVLMALAVGVTGCQVLPSPLNPLNFTGPVFLWFYAIISLLAIILAWQLRLRLRWPDDDPDPALETLDLYETAYLAAGQWRVAYTAVTRLVQQQLVTVDLKQKCLQLSQTHPVPPYAAPVHPIEQTLLSTMADCESFDLDQVKGLLIPATSAIEDHLRQLELLTRPQQAEKIQIYSGLVTTTVLLLGIAKIFVGLYRSKPVAYLVMMCLLMAPVNLTFWFMPIHRSRYGDRVLALLRRQWGKRSRDRSLAEIPMAFALFGEGVLSDRMFADLRQVLFVNEHGGGGGGCGGGGCGGGGCGGCGG